MDDGMTVPPEFLIEMSPLPEPLQMFRRIRALVEAANSASLDVVVEGCKATKSTLGYQSYLLLGQKSEGGAIVVRRWDRAPTQAEIAATIEAQPKAFSSFVLTQPCGPVLEGNAP